MLNFISSVMIVYILFNIFRSLFFVEYVKKVSFFDKHSKIKEIIGVISLILFDCLSYLFLLSVDSRIPRVLFVFACLIYCMVFNLNNIVENLILSFVFYSATWSINYACNSLESSLNLSGVLWGYITTTINLAITYLIITKVITRFINFKQDTFFSDFEYILLILFSLIGFFSLVFYKEGFSEIVAVICDIAIILFSYEFEIIRKNKERNKLLTEKNNLLERQDKILKQAISKKIESLKKSEEAEREIRRINHDLNHHFNFLLSCEGLPKKAKDYIDKLKGQTNVISKFYDTGNVLIDLVLEELRAKADKATIKFDVIGGFEEELEIEPADISVILGNIGNNALEGAIRSKDDYKKIITYFHQGSNEKTGETEFYLKVQNTADTEALKKSTDGTLITTKEDKDSHGIGLKSVKKIVNSYGGEMNIDITPGEFTVEIHIPISAKNK